MANNIVSIFINSQLPEFVRTNDPNFVAFLEAYYEYLEQSNNTPWFGKTVERIDNLISYTDIDTTLDSFTQRLYNDFLALFPNNIAGNPKLVMKHAKDFYRARGNQKSFRFLFRVLYGQEIEIFYPKDYVLKLSESTWTVDRSLSVNGITVNGVANTSQYGLDLFQNTIVTGAQSNAQALVESTLISYQSGVLTNELFISNQTRDFEAGEEIATTDRYGNRLTANIFSGILESITIVKPGTAYSIGDPVPIITRANTAGNGAAAFVSAVSTGNVANVSIVFSGAGFQIDDGIIFTGTGIGANAFVSSVIDTGFYHPANYLLNIDQLGTYDNVQLGANNYGFPNVATSNENTAMNLALTQTWAYNNTGPLFTIFVNNPGQDYSIVPSADVSGNAFVKFLGMLGKLTINSGGQNYAVNDQIEFIDTQYCLGTGAAAKVSAVDANGAITQYAWVQVPGFQIGGEGYTDPLNLPEVVVLSNTGSNANITVSGVLAYSSPLTKLTVDTNEIGQIEAITITNRGAQYNVAPLIDLSGSGDGKANAYANIITGIFTYPGRFKDETGFLSGYCFLEDEDYYQNYSYVVQVKESIDNYRKHVLDLIHPAGTKLWGQYVIDNETAISHPINVAESNISIDSTWYQPNAANFTPSSYLSRNVALSNTVASNQGTISLWINPQFLPSNTSTKATLFQVGDTTTNSFLDLSLRSTGSPSNANVYVFLRSSLSGNDYLDISSFSNTVVQANAWTHIVATWSDENVAQSMIYITDVGSTSNILLSNNLVTLSGNFQSNIYSQGTVNIGEGNAFSIVRTSNGGYFDINGNYEIALANTPRFNHQISTNTFTGLLVEPTSTNWIRNSNAAGAVLGTIGSGGALPTHWSLQYDNTGNGITSQVVTTGSEFGLQFVDLMISGSPVNSSDGVLIQFDSAFGAANVAQTWTLSVYTRLIAGSIPGQTTIFTYGGVGTGPPIEEKVSNTSITSTATRFSQNITLANTSSNTAGGGIDFKTPANTAMNCTVRLYAPQLEQGNATSPIITTGSIATRNADTLTIYGGLSFNVYNYQIAFTNGSITTSNGVSGNLVVTSANLANTRLQSYIATGYADSPINAPNTSVAADYTANNMFQGLMAELWFSNSYMNIANTTIRRQFINQYLEPTNMGANGNSTTGITPIVYLKGEGPTFNINYGTGGNYNTTGNVTNATFSTF